MNRGNLIILTFLAFVIGLGYVGSKFYHGPVTLAAYSDADGMPIEVMDAKLLVEPKIAAAVSMHETHHAFRRFGLIDYDVPTAAALGYVVEWSQVGSLSDEYRVPAFREGLAEPYVDAQDILQRYAGNQESEPVGAYDDGARLAGIALRACGGTEAGSVRYLFSVSMGLSHKNAAELCWHTSAFSMVSRLRSGEYFYFDDNLLAKEISQLGLGDARAKLLDDVIDFLGKRYRPALLRKERLSALGTSESNLEAWLSRRKRAGLDLEDRPAALAFRFYEEWSQDRKPVESDLKSSCSLGFSSTDEVGETLLRRASIETPALRRDAAILAGLMERLFGDDSKAAWRYTQMAAFGLSHVLAVAIARDAELFYLVCKLRDGHFSILDRQRLEKDLAGLDEQSRATVLGYVGQLSREYEVRYVQPALNGRGVVPYDVHGVCVRDAKTACLLNRFRVRVQWASTSTSSSGFALVTGASLTSTVFDVGGVAVKISVVDKGADGVNCRILGGRSAYMYTIEIVDVKEKMTQALRGSAGEVLDTGSFSLSDLRVGAKQRVSIISQIGFYESVGPVK